MNAQRASVVYGIRLGRYCFGHDVEERTKMLINECGLVAILYQLNDKFGWKDVVVTMYGFRNPCVIHSKGADGRVALDPDPDLVERLNKFCSDHGDCEEPRWHLYLFSTMIDAFSHEVFILPDGDIVQGQTYSEDTTGEAPSGYKPSSTGDPPSGVHW